jgi:exopolysaccharide biosynthesis polyprenyl glycosylphosphotransferase
MIAAEDIGSVPLHPDLARTRTGRVALSHRDPGPFLRACRLVDSVVAIGALLSVFVLSNLHQEPRGLEQFLSVRLSVKNLVALALFAAMWRALFSWMGLYEWLKVRDRASEALRLSVACLLGGVMALVFPLTGNGGSFLVSTVVYFTVVVALATLAARHILRTTLAPATDAVTQVVIVGTGPRAQRAHASLLGLADPHAVVGFVDNHDVAAPGRLPAPVLGTLKQLEGLLARSGIDEVVVALPIRSCYSEIQDVIEVCERVGVRAKYLADVFQHRRQSPRLEGSEGLPLIAMPMVAEDVRLVAKRLLDIAGAGLGLLLVSPVLLVAALAIKLTSPGPVLFTQERYGLNRRRFKMYKLRTMVADASARQSEVESLNQAEGPIFKIKDDPRITRVGGLLRRTSVDELPQLFNVLRGDMSLVGPRPLPMRDVERFDESWLMRRFSVLPGVTGLWQVSGRQSLQFNSLITLDLKYIDEWSLRLDSRILLRTIPAVLAGTGAR